MRAGLLGCGAVGEADGGGVGGVVDGEDLAAVDGIKDFALIADLEGLADLLRVRGEERGELFSGGRAHHIGAVVPVAEAVD